MTIHERRTSGQDKVDTVKILLDEPADIEQLKAENPGYTKMLEHYVVLYKPRVPDAEVAVIQASLAGYKTAVNEIARINLTTALKADIVAAVSKLTEAVKEPVDVSMPVKITEAPNDLPVLAK